MTTATQSIQNTSQIDANYLDQTIHINGNWYWHPALWFLIGILTSITLMLVISGIVYATTNIPTETHIQQHNQ